jgi:ADP-ribose pyrophosphatase YjhB (NUDIX family)
MPLLKSPLHKTLSAGIVVVHSDGERYRLLAVRAFNSWDFPRAPVSDGEDPLQAAMRVTSETTGLDELEFAWGDAFRETLAFEDGDVSRYYLAQSSTAEVTLRVPPGDGGQEDFEYRWATVEEAQDILPPRLALILEWVLQRLLG